MATVTLVWFRQDLRLRDNPALVAAAQRGPLAPVFVWAPHEEGAWPPGAAARWWLHQSLAALQSDLAARGGALLLCRGDSATALRAAARSAGATAVYWNRRYEPHAIARDRQVSAALQASGLQVADFNAALLREPQEVATQTGEPYRVFTPFWRSCLKGPPIPPPQPPPRGLQFAPFDRPGVALRDLQLEPAIDWAAGLRAAWTPGEAGAQRQLSAFIRQHAGYAAHRDFPAKEATSRLSPHLHWGEISPRAVWHAIEAAGGGASYQRELIWREFAHHVLFHFPHTPAEPLRPEFARFPWQPEPRLLRAWQRGRTGYPLVDAAMRQLWVTGWMHNRMRMLTASFLVKHLLQPWQDGAAWFWDTLVDADLANNTLNWQWVAGCGADAAPFFRIFNPAEQARKFDKAGAYVDRWLTPAQRGLQPIVEHRAARERALAAASTLSRRFADRF